MIFFGSLFGVLERSVDLAAKAAEAGLPEQALHRVLAVLARARINEFIADRQGKAKDIIEFAIGLQSGVGRDFGTVELQLQAAAEIQSQNSIFRFARRVIISTPQIRL